MSQRPKTTTGTRNTKTPSLSLTDHKVKNISKIGQKPEQAFIEFINHDIIKPLQRRNIYSAINFPNQQNHNRSNSNIINNNNINNNNKSNNINYKFNQRPLTSKWALGTTTPPINWETLPKQQQFKQYYFPPNYKNKKPEEYRSYSLKTDHIGIRDNKINKVKDNESFLKMKAEYSTQIESKNGWSANNGFLTVNNRPSVNYNIINFQPLKNEPNIKNGSIINKHYNNRQKGVGEYADLNYTYRPNYNKDYAKLFNDNPQRFRKFTGIFTQMYDATFRNGGLGNPFEHHKVNVINNNVNNVVIDGSNIGNK